MIPEKIILHHSATADGETVSWGAIRRYHIRECAWGDIGYHFGIEYVGGDPEILLGRMPDRDGAHTRGENQRSLGVCFVGNFDIYPPSEAIWQAGLKLVRWLCAQYKIPIQHVHGHNAFAAKSCPGTFFSVEKFRADLARGGNMRSRCFGCDRAGANNNDPTCGKCYRSLAHLDRLDYMA